MRDIKTLKYDIKLLSIFLGYAVAACVLLFLVRWIVTGYGYYGFLIWNLFLACVPFVISLIVIIVEQLVLTRVYKITLIILFTIPWLVFYPNAPYLFTDFIYIFNRAFLLTTPQTPLIGMEGLVWFDIILSSAFAFTGHFIGLVSVYLIHTTLKKVANRMTAWILIFLAMVFSGFGIYLGRFSRLNSWDLIVNPGHSLSEIISSLCNTKALMFSAVFSLFIVATYMMFYAFKRIRR